MQRFSASRAPRSSTPSKKIETFGTHSRVENDRYQGRRPKITERGKRHLIRLSKAEPYATAPEFKQKADLGISPHQINVILRKYGLKCRRPRRVPFLRPANVRHRLAWCETRKDWTAADWPGGTTSLPTSRPTRPADRRRDVYVVGLVKRTCTGTSARPSRVGAPPLVNHWGAISYWGRSELKCLRDVGRLNAKLYIKEVLEGPLKTFNNECQTRARADGVTPVIVEDNCRIHTAAASRKAENRCAVPGT